MNANQLSAYTAHRAGIILTGHINMDRLYNGYAAFCHSLGETPEAYDAVELQLANEIYGIKLWWSGIAPHIGQSVLGTYVSNDIDIACVA